MSRTTIALILGPGAVLLLAACSSASPARTITSTTHVATGRTQPAAATTTTDPCQLVTAQEALTGASDGPGKEQASAAGKTCVYGASTKNVFMWTRSRAAPVNSSKCAIR